MTSVQGLSQQLNPALMVSAARPAIASKSAAATARNVPATQPPLARAVDRPGHGIAQAAAMKTRGALQGRAIQPAAIQPPSVLAPQQPGPTLGGDVDGDGAVTVADAQALLSYLFQGGNMPAGMANADANGDGHVNIADVVRVFQLSAQNGSQPTTGTTP